MFSLCLRVKNQHLGKGAFFSSFLKQMALVCGGGSGEGMVFSELNELNEFGGCGVIAARVCLRERGRRNIKRISRISRI